MLRVGIAGIGFMGMIHYLAYQKVKGVKVTAISARDPKKRAGDWRGIKGNFGPEGTQIDLGKIARHETVEALCADPNVDVVDVCLPPALHADATVTAFKAGKHVFCEKPIAVVQKDAERMVAAAEKAGKQLLIGHVLPFFPEYDLAYKAIKGGRYGKLLGGHFKRIISDPLWIPDFYDGRKVGGPLVDLHIHDAHFIRMACGMPTSVSTQGRMRGDVVEFASTQFGFEDPDLLVTSTSGVIRQQGRAFTHAYEIHLEKATLLFDFAVIGDLPIVATPVTMLTADGKVQRPELAPSDPIDCFAQEIKEVAKSIRSGKPSPMLGGELARDALLLCHKQTESVRKRKAVKV